MAYFSYFCCLSRSYDALRPSASGYLAPVKVIGTGLAPFDTQVMMGGLRRRGGRDPKITQLAQRGEISMSHFSLAGFVVALRWFIFLPKISLPCSVF